MGATVFLDEPIDGDTEIECEEVRVTGEVVRAVPTGGGAEHVVPTSNVTGVTGDDVEKVVDEVEFAGGRVTELVTRLS